MTLKRTAAGLVLTAVAVAVPSAAWYFSGTRKIERETHLQEKNIYTKGHDQAVVLAERLARRLELLRDFESRRPFYHYRNLIHDPRTAAEGASITISPLAEGGTDALIKAHFQIDQNGQLDLPTLNEELPEFNRITDERQCALFNELEEIAFLAVDPQAFGEARFGLSKDAIGGGYIDTMTRRAWRQHRLANALYADLKYGRRTIAFEEGPGADEILEIIVGGFAWHTLPVGGKPSLVALRSVDTPDGLWTQGFVISDETIRQELASVEDPTAFVPFESGERSPRPGLVEVAIEGTPWGITLDLSERLAQTVKLAAAERESFLRLFILGILAAGIAGILVVALVYQSERLAQQRSQFAAAAAHELRTPLAGLRLYGEMLAEGLGNPVRARDYARRLAGEAERLGRVVTNVLSFTRLERGLLSVQPVPGDLAGAVEAACQRHRPALEESGARLDLELDASLPAVTFDRDALDHILQNLLDNAEKYTRGIDDRAIKVDLAMNGKGVELSVADNGRGVAPKLQRRLFRPFTRGGNRDAPEGLGLGLVLVKLLAEAQGGDIAYQDAPRGGAVFTVSLPVAEAA